MTERKHQKVTRYDKQEDGTIKITTESYYESLSHYVEEVEKPHISTPTTLEQDVLEMLKRITGKTSPKLTVTIIPHKTGYKLTEKYVTIKKKLN